MPSSLQKILSTTWKQFLHDWTNDIDTTSLEPNGIIYIYYFENSRSKIRLPKWMIQSVQLQMQWELFGMVEYPAIITMHV